MDTTAEPSIPARVGRMIILAKLGEGGMGVVYAAYDPELDRKVAVKMLLPDRADSSDTRTRLVREAQALARLAHPNIVSIHDVGVEDGRVWLAMEFIKGKTLNDWTVERPRRWAEIVEVFIQAGRGIEAAHRVGLLHRDVKPANIMIGDDGRVRVMDFGLVRTSAGSEAEQSEVATPAPFAREITQTGSVMGTPAYMAPEQFLGFAVDARADQYSLCVALWETLYGERPYADVSLASRGGNLLAGRRSPPGSRSTVPSWLRRVVERGLAPRREARFASMSELLIALAADPTRRRRLLGIGVGLGLSLAGWFAIQHLREQAAIARCDAAGAAIDEVWNDATRAGLRAGILATGASYAASVFERLTPWVDDYAEAWREARVEVCRATTIERRWSPQMALRAEACLDEQRSFLNETIEFTTNAGASVEGRGVLQAAVDHIARLTSVTACTDEQRLRSAPPLPYDPGRNAEIRHLRRVVTRIGVLDAIGSRKAALALAERTQADADALGFAPLQQRLALRRGALYHYLGRTAAAEQLLEATYFTAGRLGIDDTFVEAAGALAYVVGTIPRRHEEGLLWARTAGMLMDRLGVPADDVGRARMYEAMGTIYQGLGSYELAIENHRHALEIRQRVLGSENPAVASALGNLAIDYSKAGMPEKAIEYQARSLVISESALGRNNDRVGASMINLGIMYQELNDNNTAMDYYRRAAEIFAQTREPTHPTQASLQNSLGVALNATGAHEVAIVHFLKALDIADKIRDPDDLKNAPYHAGLANAYSALKNYELALVHRERVLAIREKARGRDHAEVALALMGLGDLHAEQGDYLNALKYYAQALPILQRTLPGDHPDTATALHNIGNAHQRLGARDRAQEYEELALAMWERTLGPQDSDLAFALTNLGVVYEHQGKLALARTTLQRAVDLRTGRQIDPVLLAESRFALAQVLESDPTEHSRAHALAIQARAAFAAAGKGQESSQARVQTWLDAHPGP